MRRRAVRIVVNLSVEVSIAGRTMHVVSQDVTPFGLFLRMDAPLAVGTRVILGIAPDGRRVTCQATVVHALDVADAEALGRKPGVGVALDLDGDAGLQAALIAVIEKNPQVTATSADLRVVVADASTRLLERLSTALGNAGFQVAVASTGVEALGAALRLHPDVVIAARELPVLDGLALLDEMGRHPELASVPVMIVGDASTDLGRLEVFQRGAMDFVHKPFTALEIILRARRLARLSRHDGDRVLVRGAVGQLGLPSLLTMIEQERKTGVLTLTRSDQLAWLTFVDGRLVRVRASDHRGDSRATLMRVLDWTDGYFELAAGGAEGEAELQESITHLLLEHARVSDERNRSKPS